MKATTTLLILSLFLGFTQCKEHESREPEPLTKKQLSQIENLLTDDVFFW